MPPPTPPRIFDRALINRRLDRAWTRPGRGAQTDFLLARAAQDLGERLSLVKRRFAVAADFGSPGPHGAVALAAFYLPGPFAGYLFGELVEILNWSAASLLMVVGPPLIGVVLMSLYDYSMAQND